MSARLTVRPQAPAALTESDLAALQRLRQTAAALRVWADVAQADNDAADEVGSLQVLAAGLLMTIEDAEEALEGALRCVEHGPWRLGVIHAGCMVGQLDMALWARLENATDLPTPVRCDLASTARLAAYLLDAWLDRVLKALGVSA